MYLSFYKLAQRYSKRSGKSTRHAASLKTDMPRVQTRFEGEALAARFADRCSISGNVSRGGCGDRSRLRRELGWAWSFGKPGNPQRRRRRSEIDPARRSGMVERNVFITGGTGYLGSRLIPRLVARGHAVRALVRPGSEGKLPAGCEAVAGDALRRGDLRRGGAARRHLRPARRHAASRAPPRRPSSGPSTWFRCGSRWRWRLGRGWPTSCTSAVAQPAPAMKAYVAVRAEGEALIRAPGSTPPCSGPGTSSAPGTAGQPC